MFTGIIEAVGKILKLEQKSSGYSIIIDVATLDMEDVKLGDSIAVNGTCLTVTAFSSNQFTADVSSETVKRTKLATNRVGDAVNLEKACTANTRLGGHIVSGHVDGIAKVTSMKSSGNATDYWLEAPSGLAKYIAEKGSVTVDGISLTVNEVQGEKFRLTIIPHTAEQTTIQNWQQSSLVNLEVDLMARYIERLISYRNSQQKDTDMLNLLEKSGFIK